MRQRTISFILLLFAFASLQVDASKLHRVPVSKAAPTSSAKHADIRSRFSHVFARVKRANLPKLSKARHATPSKHILRKSSLDRVPMLNYMNVQYTGTLNVNQQVYTTILDTGSNWLWLASKSCGNICLNTGVDHLFDCKQSPTCSAPKITELQQIEYGKGTVSGAVVKDTVTFGTATINNQSFLAVDRMKDLSEFEADGILGLLPSEEHMGSAHTVLYMMKEQKLIDDIEFSMYLTSQDAGGSELILGGADPAYMASPTFNYHELVHPSLWVINLSGLKMDNQPLASTTSPYALVDSGTSILAFDLSTTLTFLMQMDTLGFRCQIASEVQNRIICQSKSGASLEMSSMPALTFRIDQIDYTLNPQDYVIQCDHFIRLSPETVKQCFLDIVLLQEINLVILGSPFMRKYYTLFSQGKKHIGLVAAKAPALQSETSSFAAPNAVWLTETLLAQLVLALAVTIMCLVAFCAWKQFKRSIIILQPVKLRLPDIGNVRSNTLTHEQFSEIINFD